MSERQNSELAGALTRHQHHFGAMPTEDRQWAIQNTETAIGLFAEAVKNRRREEASQEPIPPLFSVIARTKLGAIDGKKTSKCFIGTRYYYRDVDFDNWLPTKQSPVAASVITTLEASRGWTFVQAASFVLGVSADTSVEMFAALLKEHGHTMTLAQAEDMVERTERGEKTDMRTDGWANFFFVENGDGSVSVGGVDRDDRVWDACVYSLDDGYVWSAGSHLFVCNLKDTLKL